MMFKPVIKCSKKVHVNSRLIVQLSTGPWNYVCRTSTLIAVNKSHNRHTYVNFLQLLKNIF